MIKAKVNKSEFDIDFQGTGEDDAFLVNGDPVSLDIANLGGNRFHIIKDNRSFEAEIVGIDSAAKTVTIKVNGAVYPVQIKGKLDLLLEQLGMDVTADTVSKEVKAPMPGLVIDILVKEGQEIMKGESLLILEAMKMENVLKSPADGIVSLLAVKKGESVEKGKILLNL